MLISDWSSDVCSSDLSSASSASAGERWWHESHRRFRSDDTWRARAADPTRRRAAWARNRERHDRRGHRARPPTMARRLNGLGSGAQHCGVRRTPRSRFCAGADPPPPPEGLFRMLALHEYRPRADRLADPLPWAALVAPRIVLNTAGGFQRTLAFRGPDRESAT